MSEDKAEQDSRQKRRSPFVTLVGEYWVRGAIYTLVALLMYSVVRPVVEYIVALENRVGFILTVALLGVFLPMLAGWVGARIFSPLFRSWRAVKGMQSWEDRIVDELTPGRQRAFPVVIVEWPSEDVRTLAVLASRYTSSCGTKQLACVFMPGSPDPLRGGALRIVAIDNIEMTDWSMSDLFTNCISFGATSPELFSETRRKNGASPEHPSG